MLPGLGIGNIIANFRGPEMFFGTVGLDVHFLPHRYDVGPDRRIHSYVPVQVECIQLSRSDTNNRINQPTIPRRLEVRNWEIPNISDLRRNSIR